MSATKSDEDVTRRDILYVGTAAFGAVGAGAAVWPLVDQMNPDASVLALAATEVDLSAIEPGQNVVITWRGKPVFIRHRTAEEIAAAQADDTAALPDPQNDAERVQRPQWLVMVGVCTHLGCVPMGEAGEYNGWFCPCHGSHYDLSGRIRKGPAPTNLEVPQYTFLSDTLIRIG